jgi:flagellar biosynthetic protein FlhB
MAEDNGDKTEAPTPRRRSEAREQGNIARSPDLAASVVILGLLLMLKWYGPGLVQALKTLMAELLSADVLGDHKIDNLFTTLLRSVMIAARALAPLLLGALFVAVLVNVLQVGFFFSGKRLQPNFAALNPVNGLTRLFGGGNGIVQLLMNTAKMLLVGTAAYSAIHGRMAQIVTVQQLTFLQIFGLGAQIVYSIIMRITILLLVLSIGDYIYQRHKIEKSLKMSKQEVKDEMKSMDGDPKVKQRRRQIAIQRMTQQFRKTVPKADVVVTNPTEFAVAIQYDSDSMHAPRVVAKGQGYMAMKIREIAIESGVPILERKPLARALYKLVDIGQEIPEQFYSAIAEILAYVYELSGKMRKRDYVNT